MTGARLSYCRYYHGERVNPFVGISQNKTMLWFYEMCWVNEKSARLQAEYVSEYQIAGLSDFCEGDGIPLSLKALLFNRYSKNAYSLRSAAKPFKIFYLKYYG